MFRILPALVLISGAFTKTISYNWDITWVRANPDGLKDRPVIGVNGKFPCPTIEADLGDTIEVKVNNKLGNETTGIHFHGMSQRGTNHMDGPSGVTQCPIPPGESFTYRFKADPAGSYWWHSHNMGQYPDGLRGPMIIYDKNGRSNLPIRGDPSDYQKLKDEFCKKKGFASQWLCGTGNVHKKGHTYKRSALPNAFPRLPGKNGPGQHPGDHDGHENERSQCEKEYVVTVSDWYHDELAGPKGLVNYYLSAANLEATDGAEPIPQSTLINDAITDSFDVKSGKKYLFRFINLSALAAHFIEFDDHNMTVVAVDGEPTKPISTKTIRLTPAQRYDVILETKANATRNYAFITQMDNDLFDTPQPDSVTIGNGILRYGNFPDPPPYTAHDVAIDDIVLFPASGEKLLGTPDRVLNMTINFGAITVGGQEVQRASMGNHSYLGQKVPTLYTALTTGKDALNPVVYGEYVNPFIFKYGDVVQLIINNADGGFHPMHIHLHKMQLLWRGATYYDGSGSFPASPMKRDTIEVPPLGGIVLRFKADNPGIALFHCHIEWHVEAGKTVTFIEAPDKLQQLGIQLPADHKNVCSKMGMPVAGNCAGNTKTPTDVSQCVTTFDPNPVGAYWTGPVKRRSVGGRVQM